MKFNPHDSRTADGVLITLGLVVFTNEIEVGRVVGDTHSCCDMEGQPAQMRVSGVIYTDHDLARSFPTCVCRHDHWFEVEVVASTDDGYTLRTTSMNGERLTTVLNFQDQPSQRVRAVDEAPEWFQFPHNYTLGGRGKCSNSALVGHCRSAGTGDPENDGPCTFHPDYFKA